MDTTQKEIAVLLTVFNRREQTLGCLSRLFSQQVPDGYKLEAYLVEDNCSDGTADAVLAQFPQVHLIHGDGNLYWNRGMYTAWEAASEAKDYDYYLWLNDDTNLFEGAVAHLLQSSENHQDKAIIVGATVDTTTRTKQTYGGRVKGHIPALEGLDVEVEHFNGNIVLVPRSVFAVLGNLDWYFTHSKGDFDYGLRAKKMGIKMYQVGTALGECDVHETLDTWCNPDVPLRKRWSMLHRPNGMPPKETFHLENRHMNIFVASFHFLTVYIRCLFPAIWKLKKS